jgi:hypothetical protein
MCKDAKNWPVVVVRLVVVCLNVVKPDPFQRFNQIVALQRATSSSA